jgi:hypothetical protein
VGGCVCGVESGEIGGFLAEETRGLLRGERQLSGRLFGRDGGEALGDLGRAAGETAFEDG